MANVIMSKTAITGNASSALDNIDGNSMNQQDLAHVMNGRLYQWWGETTGGSPTEVSPFIIRPDTNPTGKQWKLLHYYQPYYFGTLGSMISSNGSNIAEQGLIASAVTEAGTYWICGQAGFMADGTLDCSTVIRTGASATYGNCTYAMVESAYTAQTGVMNLSVVVCNFVKALNAGDYIHLGGRCSSSTNWRYIQGDTGVSSIPGMTALFWVRII
jgi:hypothetical protein